MYKVHDANVTDSSHPIVYRVHDANVTDSTDFYENFESFGIFGMFVADWWNTWLQSQQLGFESRHPAKYFK